MSSAIPGNRLRDGVSLVQFAPGCRIVQPSKRREADSRQAPVEGIVRNPYNSRASGSRHVRRVRKQVRCKNVIVIVVYAKHVAHAPFAVHPTSAGVQPLRSRASGERREWIYQVVRTARPVQPKIDVVLRSPSSSTASTPATPYGERTESRTTACAEVVDQPQHHGIGIALRGRHVAKVLAGSRRRN